jgi:hypothetical protein
VTVTFDDLGRWGGARLIAEYDPEADAIRIDRRAFERVRSSLGEDAARRFVAYALEHERFHRANPRASEAQAHAAAERAGGSARAVFEAALRT